MTQPAKHAGVTSWYRVAAPADLTSADSFRHRNTAQVKIKGSKGERDLSERRCQGDTALLVRQVWIPDTHLKG